MGSLPLRRTWHRTTTLGRIRDRYISYADYVSIYTRCDRTKAPKVIYARIATEAEEYRVLMIMGLITRCMAQNTSSSRNLGIELSFLERLKT